MHRTKILIVEDERLAAEDLSIRMTKLGCEVVGISSTGKDAIMAAAQTLPDVILMDIQLRGNLNGIETAKLIHDTQPTPVIFATAYGDDAHIIQALNDADPYGFLHKPVDDKAAFTMIQIALARFAKDQEVLGINKLLTIKDQIYGGFTSTQSIHDIISHVSNIFAESHLFEETWVVLGGNEEIKTDNINNGFDQKLFDNYLAGLTRDVIDSFKTFDRDELMSSLVEKHAYAAPLIYDDLTFGLIGFTRTSILEPSQSEIVIYNDIAKVISQSIHAAVLKAEKQESQRLVAESDLRLKAVVEKSSTGIYLVDNNFIVEYANDMLCEIFDRKKEDVIGHKFTEFLGKFKELVVERYIARQAGKEVPGDYELEIFRPNGEIRNLLISANAFRDTSGNMRSAGHVLDITDQKKANLELSKLSHAVEQSPVMTIITDLDGTIEYVNTEFTNTMGYTADEVLGKKVRILKSGIHDQAFYKNMWDTITNGNIWTGELTNRKKDGVVNWEKASIAPIRNHNGDVTHFVSLKEDITEYKREQEKALKNQKLRDVLYEITSAAIQSKDVSSLYESIYRYISEIISTSNFYVALYNKVENNIYFPFDKDIYESELPESIPCDPEVSLTARTIVSGETLHLEQKEIQELLGIGQILMAGEVPSVWLGIPLIVNSETIGAFVMQEYDGITRYADEDVRMLDLAAGQVAMTIDRARKDEALRELAEELSNANGMKELLLDVITHDLKNPAGVISSITEMLQEEDSDNEMFELLKTSSSSLLEVIENASVMSKLTLGESIAKEELDLVQMLNDVALEFGSQLSLAGIAINMEMPESLLVEANTILSEIPKNYISNAIKYASTGGKIDLLLHNDNDQIVFRVNDYGSPIPEEKRVEVFERSIQLAEGKKSGRGLGLAIVKRIADAHDAEVGVELSPGGGNSFYLKM